MPQARHLLFKNPQEGLVEFIGRPGGGGVEEDQEDKNYLPMAEEFERCIKIFSSDQDSRHKKRTIDVPNHIDLIELEFQSYFDQPEFEQHYYNSFGLAILQLYSFNKKGLFAIIDEEKFSFFFEQIQEFIKEAEDKRYKTNYDNHIKFLKSFSLHSSSDMVRLVEDYRLVQLRFLINDLISKEVIIPQKDSLFNFLKKRNIVYDCTDNHIELQNINADVLELIIDNYDILDAATSTSGSIIRPGNFNLPERTYGFSISNHEEDLPIVGVIDTGVNADTPLESIIIKAGTEYDLTSTNLFLDEADHGTAIACLAALGKEPIPGYSGEYRSSCKILPIKVLHENSGIISPFKIGEIIRKAHKEYKVRIFTLTIGYSNFPLQDNQEYSEYAKILDEVTYDLDILILISTTNNQDRNIITHSYPNVFNNRTSNIASPAESINSLVIGSTSDCFESERHVFAVSPSRECPASYSRKFHYNFEDDALFNQSNRNYQLRKPDILLPGGEYTEFDILGTGLESESSGIEILSADLRHRTIRNIGSSLSVGYAANIVSKLVKLYPSLDMQTIKALMINESTSPNLGRFFNSFSQGMKKRIWGFGSLNIQNLYFSDTNRVSLIIEDEIEINHTKSYPINLPKYFNSAATNRGIIKITATISFKVNPIINNQLLYCPIHLSFAIGKNLVLENNSHEERVDRNGRPFQRRIAQGINGNSGEQIKINRSAEGWAQDFYYKSKILSNVQKVEFKVNKEDIITEDNCFKIAIACSLHKLLPVHERDKYETAHPYSLVLTIEQFPIAGEIFPSLYDELLLCNELEIFGEQDIDLDLSI